MLQALLYPAIFVGGGIFGWVLDTTYRSLIAKKYTPGTLVPFFAIIYGIGAVMLYLFFSSANISFLWSVVGGTVLCVVLELVGGIVSQAVLRHRLWDYTASPFNFYGLIDIEHTFYWSVLTVLYRIFYKLVV
jgi:uncharacterized membrane protein